jgi:hypothetical protein
MLAGYAIGRLRNIVVPGKIVYEISDKTGDL